MFDVTRDGAGTHEVVALFGALDLATAPQLAEALRWRSHLDTAELYVDTAEVTFCYCAGLRVLLAAAESVNLNEAPSSCIY